MEELSEAAKRLIASAMLEEPPPGAEDGSWGTVVSRLTVEARVRGQRSSFEVPVALRREGATLVATGALELRQSQLGLVPFSVMMGALQVQDAMRLEFRVVARP